MRGEGLGGPAFDFKTSSGGILQVGRVLEFKQYGEGKEGSGCKGIWG